MLNTLAHLIDGVPINTTRRVWVGGRAYLVKQRRPGRGLLIAGGNLFLKASASRIQMFRSAQAWQAWELACYRHLYGCEGRAVGANTLWLPALPGESLKSYLLMGKLNTTMLQTAARELRRAHSLKFPLLKALWSHGDLHLDNVLYDAETGRASLVDFETRHESSLSSEERHADDLLVLLLDLLGRADTRHWQEWSETFLTAYGQWPVLRCLHERLHPPRGLEAALWKTRTAHAPDRLLRERLKSLRASIDKLC
jgi:hypothetical protein